MNNPKFRPNRIKSQEEKRNSKKRKKEEEEKREKRKEKIAHFHVGLFIVVRREERKRKREREEAEEREGGQEKGPGIGISAAEEGHLSLAIEVLQKTAELRTGLLVHFAAPWTPLCSPLRLTPTHGRGWELWASRGLRSPPWDPRKALF